MDRRRPKPIKRESLSDKIKKDVENSLEKRKGTGAWLHGDSVPFDHALRLSANEKTTVLQLFDSIITDKRLYGRNQKILDLEILLANLFTKRGVCPIAISFNRNDWKSSPYTQAGYFTLELVRRLHGAKYIEMRKGYHTEKESRKTRIWPTDKLLNYCPELPNCVIYEPVELVELRDKKGKLKEYKNTARTYKIRSILKKANSINQAADIRYREYQVSCHLVAIFNKKFTLYGRLHTRGHRHYQGFSGDERTEITINGHPVVELDYSGLHPHLLYAKQGIQFFGDPYSVVDNRPETRPFLKQILLCMLNAEDEINAERAANYWLFRNHEERDKLGQIGITRARPLIEAFKEAHRPISGHFCNGKDTGLRVMNCDAAIALEVVDHFAKQNIPILAIHDSFVVQEQYRAELLKTMQRAYRKHTGFRCPIH
ncbi:MAG: hypothetical protein AVO38_10985 [delta proteobacterium ML8_D]|nr:MAG: hypothetical protein AVO34_05375 [Firmicutes bacterium ML8_F2]OPL15111.1 MAG: hypothetical protein AVO38_10985 [delta proteobacterium ML8_D]